MTLTKVANKLTGTYSGGMKRRLDLASALMHQPPLLILDEPTEGLDPQSRTALWEELERINRTGTSMLLTTHYMEEADRLCDRLAIIDNAFVVEGSPPSRSAASVRTRSCWSSEASERDRRPRSRPLTVPSQGGGRGPSGGAAWSPTRFGHPDLLRRQSDAGIAGLQRQPARRRFMKYTGRSIGGGGGYIVGLVGDHGERARLRDGTWRRTTMRFLRPANGSASSSSRSSS
jgi:hypothetical protein